MKGDNNKSEKSITLTVERHGQIFRFSKMWGYLIRIPGLLPTMPLEYYYYIGITTQYDPMVRIKKHVSEDKHNPPFEEIRKLVPFDLWDITIFEIPIIGNDGNENIKRLTQWEKDNIAEYDTFHAEYGLNMTPGGEDPFDGSKPIGWATGIAYTYWSNNVQSWVYDNVIHPVVMNKDLRILSSITEELSKEIDVPHIIDPKKANYYFNLSDSYRYNVKKKRNIFGAKQINMQKTPRCHGGYCFAWTRRVNGVKKQNKRSKGSTFLQVLKEEADLQEMFFNFNIFMYKAIAAQLGYFDLDQKIVQPTFITQDQFNTCYNFTLDQIDAAIDFLKVIEAGVIPEPIKVLLPQTLNTTTNT